MRRILVQWGRITIYSYAAMLYLGIVLGVLAQYWAATQLRLDAARLVAATLLLLIPALAGARLLFVVTHWGKYGRDPRRIWRASEGGASMYGGFLVAVPLSVPVLAMLNIPFAAFWDTASFTMLVGMMFARVGCLLNGCCSGRPTTGWFAVNLPDHRGVRARRIPTQMLEAGWALVIVAGAVLVLDRPPFSGAIFLGTIGAYGLGRYVFESARQEQERVMGVALHRALSVALIVASLAGFAIAGTK